MIDACSKSVVIFCFCFISIVASNAQGNFSFTEFPDSLQLYARDANTNLATVIISGNESSNQFTAVELNVYRENVLIHNQTETLVYNAGTALFNLQYDITAELANYNFEFNAIDANGTVTLVKEASDVVAGDVFIIDGQSNAECRMRSTSASIYQNDFIRVFDSGTQYSNQLLNTSKWFIGDVDGDRNADGNTGQWGAKLAAEIITNHQIPVAIFNGAHGGTPISFHQKNDLDPLDLSTNYGRLLYRLNQTNLTDAVKAIYWYQGESDANASMSEQVYYDLWIELYNDWKSDFSNTLQFYIHQIRLGCNGTPEKVVEVQSAQFQLAEDLSDVQIMTAKGIPFHTDNCHYDFIGGAEEIGNRMYQLLNRDIYNNQSQTNIDAPQPALAYFSDINQITIELKNQNDNYNFELGTEQYFSFSDTTNLIASVVYNGAYSYQLNMTKPVSNLTSFTFYGFGGSGITSPSLKNANNIGMVSFKNFPIVDCLSLNASANIMDALCYGENSGEATLSINNGLAPYQINWSNNEDSTSIDSLIAGTYSYNIIDANGCKKSDSITIAEPSEIILTAVSVDESISGENDGVINLAVLGGVSPYSYNWSNGATWQDVNNLSPGIYTVDVTDANNCVANYSVTILPGILPCIIPTNILVNNIQNTSATISWNAEANDIDYIVEYKEQASNTWISFNSNFSFTILNNLLPCTFYDVRIKANCPSAQSSSFSNLYSFETTGCIEPCATIQGLFSQNITTSSAFLVWDIVPNATYTMYYRTAGSANWFTYPTQFPIAILFTLPACTDFEWYVEVNCPNGQTSNGSPIAIFSTSGAACKNNNNLVDTNLMVDEVNIFPNPISNVLNISFQNNLNENVTVKIFNVDGKLLFSSNHYITLHVNQISLDLNWLNNGFYILEINSINKKLSKQILKQVN